jgi:hypothetical protein
MDSYCLSIQRKAAAITSHPPGASKTYVFSRLSQPLAPANYRSTSQILEDAENGSDDLGTVGARGTASMQRTLLRGWRIVDGRTREPRQGVYVPALHA